MLNTESSLILDCLNDDLGEHIRRAYSFDATLGCSRVLGELCSLMFSLVFDRLVSRGE